MAIARNPVFVIDCPDPAVLARFYGELLGWGPGAPGAARRAGGLVERRASRAGGEIAPWPPKSQAIDRDPARPRTSTTEGNAR